jgi:hypothetical protein
MSRKRSENRKAAAAERKVESDVPSRVGKEVVTSSSELIIFDYSPERVDAYKFSMARNRLIDYIGSKFANVDNIFKYSEDYRFVRPTPPTPEQLDPVNDPIGMVKWEYQERIKLIIKKEEDYKENKRLVYSILWSHCSPSLQNAIKQARDYDEIEENKDLLELWTSIDALCIAGEARNIDETKRKVDAQNRLNRIHQYPGEHIGVFYERLKNELEANEAAGNHLIEFVEAGADHDQLVAARADRHQREERMKAIMFLNKLDRRIYGTLLDSLQNDYGANKAAYPETLVAAYQRAITYKVDGKYLSDMKMSVPPSSTAFVTSASSEKIGKAGKNVAKELDSKGTKELSKPASNASATKCHFCNQNGHWKKDCPLLAKAAKELARDKRSKDSHEDMVNLLFTDEDAYVINADTSLKESDILCDNQATVSIFKNENLLKNIRKSDRPIKVQGIGGSITVNKVGNFGDFGVVYFNPSSAANILCYFDLVTKAGIKFDEENNKFIATLNKKQVEFKPKGKLYVWDCDSNSKPKVQHSNINNTALVQTVEDNLRNFTKREIKLAEEARDLQIRLGYPSVYEMAKLIRDGKIQEVSINDLDNAFKIWGKDLGSLKGKTTRKTPSTINIEGVQPMIERNIILCVDIFFISGIPFLLSISRRLQLLVVTHLTDRSQRSLEKAILQHIDTYASKEFKVTTIFSDGEGAIVSCSQALQAKGVTIDITSKNEHVPEIERAGRQLKERVRAHWNTLPYELNLLLLVALVKFCCSTINSFPKENSIGSISPKELFTGIKVDLKRDFKVPFGEYCQIHEDDIQTNTLKERTVGAIALGSTGNLHGAYTFLNVSTGKVIRRRSWTRLPIPSEVIKIINDMAQRENGKLRNEEVDEGTEENTYTPTTIESPIFLPTNEVTAIDQNQIIESIEGVDNITNLETQTSEDILTEENQEPAPEIQVVESTEVPEVRHRYNLRAKRSNWQDRFAMALTSYSVSKGIKELGVDAVKSMMQELSQLHQKGAFEPVHYNDLTHKQKRKIIRSIMFIKKKRDGRTKSRCVGDGSMQDRSTSEDVSSPTVSTEGLFISSAIDAAEGRHVIVLDIEGAYIHALMKNEVIMEIDEKMSILISYLYPESYEKFIHRGKIYVILKRALYGCIESAKLFYEDLSSKLIKFGFKPNPYDACIFNKMAQGKQVTVTVHVDDLKISCQDPRGVKDTVNYLRMAYGKVSVQDGNKFDYLGMLFDYSEAGKVKISMNDQIDEVLSGLSIKAEDKSATPAANNLFTVNEDSVLLSVELKESFHSHVAKLLYISKRARPDILTAISFLTSKVQNPSEEDWKKLIKVAKYLNSTKHLYLTLSAEKDITITSYIDSSFAIHPDGKGHTGAVITLGGGSVRSRSTKQKVVARSSTESELIGLSDEMSQVLWTRNFLLEQGYKVDAATVMQDNMSTITMANKGRSTSNRTRHIAIRYFFVKDRIESKEIKIKYEKTDEMVADYFTKPLQGELFRKHRATILNE